MISGDFPGFRDLSLLNVDNTETLSGVAVLLGQGMGEGTSASSGEYSFIGYKNALLI